MTSSVQLAQPLFAAHAVAQTVSADTALPNFALRAPSVCIAPLDVPTTAALTPPQSGNVLQKMWRDTWGGWNQYPGILPRDAGNVCLTEEKQALRQRIQIENLRNHVYTLADPKLAGRDNKSPGGQLARDYLLNYLKKFPQLQPTFGSSFEQTIYDGETKVGTNVAAILPANEPNPNGDYIVVVAHYDHLGLAEGKMHLGANDNASGVAVALENLKALTESVAPRQRDIVFLFADAEEPPDVRTPRMGSNYFMEHLPRAKEKLRFGLVMDVVGTDAIPGKLLVLGAETSAQNINIVNQTAPESGAQPLVSSVAMIDGFPLLPRKRLYKSDYQGFVQHNIPFLMLTTGTDARYHTPGDRADTVNYPKLTAVARYVGGLILEGAKRRELGHVDTFAADPQADLNTVEYVVRQILKNPPQGLLPSLQKNLKQSLTELVELRTKLTKNGKLSPQQFRNLQLIALLSQHAMTRPTLSTSELLWRKITKKHT